MICFVFVRDNSDYYYFSFSNDTQAMSIRDDKNEAE